MDIETAKASVDFLLTQSPAAVGAHHVLRRRNADEFPAAQAGGGLRHRTGAAQGRSIDFSLTTNATLLTPAIIEFLSGERIGVTVSMDGPPDLHDKLRVFANGRAVTTSSRRASRR
jgi:uncharacterized protein